jgi:DNA-binding Lrp family transcriptional regulator
MSKNLELYIHFEAGLLQELTARQCVLFAVICSMSVKNGYAFAQNSTLAKVLNCSVDILQRDLNELEKKGFIKRDLNKNKENNSTMRKIYPHRKNAVDPTVKLQHPHRKNTVPPTADLRHPPPQNCGVDNNKDIIQVDIKKNTRLEGFLNLWFDHRKEQGQNLTPTAKKLIESEAAEKYLNDDHFGKAVTYSIKNNYKSIVDPVKTENNTPTKYATLDQ